MSSDDDATRDKDDPWRGSNYFPDRAKESAGSQTDEDEDDTDEPGKSKSKSKSKAARPRPRPDDA